VRGAYRERIGERADANGAAEEEAGCEDNELDAGADNPDRAAASGKADHQSVARARTECSPDASTCGDAVEGDAGDHQQHAHRKPVGSSGESHHGVDDDTDSEDIAECPEARALLERQPEQQHKRPHDY